MMKTEFARGIYKQNQIVQTAFWNVNYRLLIIRNHSITRKYVVNDMMWYVKYHHIVCICVQSLWIAFENDAWV